MHIIFTKHAYDQMEERKLLKYEVIEAVKRPTKVIKKHGVYYYQKKLDRGIIEMPCERTESHIKIITVYWI